MNKEALGVIETVGMAAAIQAADTCVKSANVELIGYELSKGSGLVTIKIRGNVGAVKAAIEAAKVSAASINKVYATLIIPRPAENLEGIIESKETVGIKAEEEKNIAEKDKITDNIELNADHGDEIKGEIDTTVSTEEQGEGEQESTIVDESNEEVQKAEENSEDAQTLEIYDEVENKTLVSDDFSLDSPRSEEDSEEERPDEENNQETEEFSEGDSSLNEQENDEVCNICHDPACTRKKGQPKTLCINYKGTRR